MTDTAMRGAESELRESLEALDNWKRRALGDRSLDYSKLIEAAAKTTAERQRDFRARKAEQQAAEVRGIFAHLPAI